MKKIRFVNPIKACIEIQGKRYTAVLITAIVAAILLSLVAAVANMPVCGTVSGIAGIGSVIGFGWWFGTEQWAK